MQEVDLMNSVGHNKFKKKDKEFNKAAGIMKSAIAIYGTYLLLYLIFQYFTLFESKKKKNKICNF